MDDNTLEVGILTRPGDEQMGRRLEAITEEMGGNRTLVWVLGSHANQLHTDPKPHKSTAPRKILDYTGAEPFGDPYMSETTARPPRYSVDVDLITRQALAALELITASLRNHPDTGQGRRLTAFLAGCYNGDRFPFDLTDLRGLDLRLSDACLDFLRYDRLGIKEVHKLLPGGDKELHQWIRDYDLWPPAWEEAAD